MVKKKVAKKSKVNKTQLIKEAMAKNPDATPIEIAESLKNSGITAQYVSTVKFNMKNKGQKPGAKKSGTRRTIGKGEPTYTLSELVKASELAEKLGGIEKATELLNAINKLS